MQVRERERERQTDRQTDRQAERQTDRQTDRHTDRQTETDRPTHRRTDTQTETETETQRHFETLRNSEAEGARTDFSTASKFNAITYCTCHKTGDRPELHTPGHIFSAPDCTTVRSTGGPRTAVLKITHHQEEKQINE